MEFFVIASVALLIGSILGFISFFKVKGLEAQITRLTNELNLLRRSFLNKQETPPEVSPQQTAFDEKPLPKPLEVAQPTITKPLESNNQIDESVELPQPTDEQINKPIPSNEDLNNQPTGPALDIFYVGSLIDKFKDNWMLWMGGLSIAVAGVFLARYAIQHGVLGPVGRIISGVVTGICLHIAAEYLRRRTGESHPTFAMLAAGGSIGLFATLLAALHLYEMISPMFVFIVLALVALATMWLSLIHGPILAAMGMVGAYVLPILVSTGQGNVNVALAYSLIITVSLLLLLHHVKRSWLWYGLSAGSLMWWFISVDSSTADLSRQVYLAILGYAFLSVMQRDWSLARSVTFPDGLRFYRLNDPGLEPTERWVNITMLVVVAAQLISIVAAGFSNIGVPVWALLSGVLLSAAMKNSHLAVHVWLILIGVLGAFLLLQLDLGSEAIINPINEIYQSDFLINMGLVLLLFSGLAYRNAIAHLTESGWTAMTLVTPIFVMLTTYLLVPDLLSQNFWALSGLLLGALYIFLATSAKTKDWSRDWEIWLYLSGHFAYSFAAVVFFDNGTLTLAIALQVLSLATIIKRYEVPQLGWLLKLITTITVIRLSANPWLVDYPSDIHWTIWTYSGSFIAVLLASRVLQDEAKLRLWVTGAAMHLLVLAIWVELRYYLYSGDAFAYNVSFTEAALMTLLFGFLSLVYYYRASIAEHTSKLYRLYSYGLMIIAVGVYAIILIQTLDNDVSVRNAISETPLWNLLLIAYGLPILLFWLAMRYFKPQLKQYFEYLTAVAVFVFINLEIRHLWQGNLNFRLPTSDGEYYTYSVFWLLASIAMIFLSAYRLGRRHYKAGLTMLALVVIKVFFFDMSQLDGIYRILSFMGLGLCLLAMAYVHNRLVVILDERN